MARTPRKHSLESRTERAKIKGKGRHWVRIGKGLALGYRPSKAGGTWYTRKKLEGDNYRFEAIGQADDLREADGVEVLDYFQAADKARTGTAVKVEKSTKYRVGEALDEYLEWFRAHRKSVRDTEISIDGHIRPRLGSVEVGKLTARQIRQWMQAVLEAPRIVRGKEKPVDASDPEAVRRRKATVNRVLTILKAALNFAYHEGRTPSADEWRKVKPYPGVDVPKVRYLTEKECTRLMNACEPDFRSLVQGALLTGCRYGELIRLEVGDYHADAGSIHIRVAKGGKPRFVPLTEEGQAFFKRQTAGKIAGRIFEHDSTEWMPGEKRMVQRTIRIPWGESHQSRPMQEACAKAKIKPPVSFHDLRHTYASLLAKAGVPLQIIAAALGHADIRMTERHYAHLAPDHVAQQIRANLPALGIDVDNVRAIGGRANG